MSKGDHLFAMVTSKFSCALQFARFSCNPFVARTKRSIAAIWQFWQWARSGRRIDTSSGSLQYAAMPVRTLPTREAPMSTAEIRRPKTFAPQTGLEARRAIRRGEYTGHTAGVAPGYVQGNLAILPRDLAADFARFCHLNPKPCPLLASSEPGDWRLPTLAADFDIRTDLPRYRVWRHGKIVDEPTDVLGYWRDDLVSFVLGCSHSFEAALVED